MLKVKAGITTVLHTGSLETVRSYIKFGSRSGFQFKVVGIFNHATGKSESYQVTITR